MPCPQCAICQGTGEVLHRDLKDFVFGAPGTWTIKQCEDPACRLIWLDPCPTKDTIAEAYQNYYTHTSGGKGQLGRQEWLRNIYHLILNGYLHVRFGYPSPILGTLLSPLALLHPGGLDEIAVKAMFLASPNEANRLLEIGCGSGYLLQRMHSLGWEVEGVEFDPACVGILNGVGISCRLGDVRDQNFTSNSFNAIFMGHVIEHVYDPASFLKECLRILRPGGRLILMTPNADSWGHKKYGQDWRGLEPPRHLQIFAPANLRRLGAQCGFVRCRTRTTNRGAWYIRGTSSEIRRARLSGSAHLPGSVRMLSPSGLLRQLFGRIAHHLFRDSGEEIIFTASKA